MATKRTTRSSAAKASDTSSSTPATGRKRKQMSPNAVEGTPKTPKKGRKFKSKEMVSDDGSDTPPSTPSPTKSKKVLQSPAEITTKIRTPKAIKKAAPKKEERVTLSEDDIRSLAGSTPKVPSTPKGSTKGNRLNVTPKPALKHKKASKEETSDDCSSEESESDRESPKPTKKTLVKKGTQTPSKSLAAKVSTLKLSSAKKTSAPVRKGKATVQVVVTSEEEEEEESSDDGNGKQEVKETEDDSEDMQGDDVECEDSEQEDNVEELVSDGDDDGFIVSDSEPENVEEESEAEPAPTVTKSLKKAKPLVVSDEEAETDNEDESEPAPKAKKPSKKVKAVVSDDEDVFKSKKVKNAKGKGKAIVAKPALKDTEVKVKIEPAEVPKDKVKIKPKPAVPAPAPAKKQKKLDATLTIYDMPTHALHASIPIQCVTTAKVALVKQKYKPYFENVVAIPVGKCLTKPANANSQESLSAYDIEGIVGVLTMNGASAADIDKCLEGLKFKGHNSFVNLSCCNTFGVNFDFAKFNDKHVLCLDGKPARCITSGLLHSVQVVNGKDAKMKDGIFSLIKGLGVTILGIEYMRLNGNVTRVCGEKALLPVFSGNLQYATAPFRRGGENLPVATMVDDDDGGASSSMVVAQQNPIKTSVDDIPVYDMTQAPFDWANDFDRLDHYPVMSTDPKNAYGLVCYNVVRQSFQSGSGDKRETNIKLYFNVDWVGVLHQKED